MKKAIVLGGQTASGKSSLAVKLAKKYNGIIISADSMQIYRKMDIGTAKPGIEDMSDVPHRLINILDTDTPFSAAEFITLAKSALAEAEETRKLPIITGGTGLYSRMLFESASLSDDRDDGIRRSLSEKSPDELYELLMKTDPESAARTHVNNVRRVIRYLEIFYKTGKTATEMNKSNNSAESEYSPLYICLYSADRTVIYSRINNRVDKMIADGLEEEVRSLYENGLENTPTASAAIGYKEFFPYFRGEATLEETTEKIKQNSRNYAKRQETFFKRIPGVIMTDISEEGYEERIFETVKQYIEN